jgi:large subunit ribosomal protein L37Ae
MLLTFGEYPFFASERKPNKRNKRATGRLQSPVLFLSGNIQYYKEIIKLGRTKKVGSTGRFGVRYGAKLRRRVLDIEKKRNEPTRCPACATRALKRKAVGLWKCNKCDLLFAGGAYVPFTDAGKAAKRAIAQRISGDFLALRDDDDEIADEDVLEFLPNIETEEEEIVLDAETITATEDDETSFD